MATGRYGHLLLAPLSDTHSLPHCAHTHTHYFLHQLSPASASWDSLKHCGSAATPPQEEGPQHKANQATYTTYLLAGPAEPAVSVSPPAGR